MLKFVLARKVWWSRRDRAEFLRGFPRQDFDNCSDTSFFSLEAFKRARRRWSTVHGAARRRARVSVLPRVPSCSRASARIDLRHVNVDDSDCDSDCTVNLATPIVKVEVDSDADSDVTLSLEASPQQDLD